MSLQAYLGGDNAVHELGRMTPSQPTDVAVATTSTTVLAADTTRNYALFVNNSDTAMRLSLDGTAATATDGLLLRANGGYYEMGPAWGNLTTAAVYAIHSGTGTKTLVVTTGAGV